MAEKDPNENGTTKDEPETKSLPSSDGEKVNNIAKDTSSSTTKSLGTGTSVVDEAYSLHRVKRQLRLLGEPVTLFGETDAQRIERLKQIQLRKQDIEESSAGQKNRMVDVRQTIEKELSAVEELRNAQNNDDEQVQRRRQLQEEIAKKKAEKFSKDRPRSEFQTSGEYAVFAVKRLVYIWETELGKRDVAEVKSPEGIQATATFDIVKKDVKPFYEDVRSGTIDKDLLHLIDRMLQQMQERDYLHAHETFIQFSIGNAAWPMGVSNVGIHERAAREKISNDKVSSIQSI